MKARTLIEMASELEDNYWNKLLAFTNALRMMSQIAHWTCKGNAYFGDHLLFERLYNETNDEIDGVAEHAIGETNDDTILTAPRWAMMTADCISHFTSDESQSSLTAMMLAAERSYVDFVSEMKSSFEEEGVLSDGVDNFLQGIADKHGSHIYLLQQRSK